MNKFKIGDKVKLNPEISDFTYCRANVGYDEIGEIHRIHDNDKYAVEFPSYGKGWTGYGDELILADEATEHIKNDSITLKAVSIKIDKMEEEKDMNKILQLYKERKEKEIKDKYDKLVEEEYNKIEFIKVYNNLVDAFEGAMKELFENEENIGCKYMEATGVSDSLYKYTLNSSKIKREIEEKHNDDYMSEIKKLDDFIKEVETTLSLAENGNGEINQDRVIEILSNYQIIDQKTLKINA